MNSSLRKITRKEPMFHFSIVALIYIICIYIFKGAGDNPWSGISAHFLSDFNLIGFNPYPFFSNFWMVLGGKLSTMFNQNYEFGIQLLNMLAHLGIGLSLMNIIKRKKGVINTLESTTGSNKAYIYYLYNPVSFSIIVFYGNMDTIVIMFLFLSAIFLHKSIISESYYYILSSFFLAMTISTKFFTIVLLPAYVLYLFLNKRKRSSLAFCVSCLVFVLFFHMPLLVHDFNMIFEGFLAISQHAPNDNIGLTYAVAGIISLINKGINFILPGNGFVLDSGFLESLDFLQYPFLILIFVIFPYFYFNKNGDLFSYILIAYLVLFVFNPTGINFNYLVWLLPFLYCINLSNITLHKINLVLLLLSIYIVVFVYSHPWISSGLTIISALSFLSPPFLSSKLIFISRSYVIAVPFLIVVLLGIIISDTQVLRRIRSGEKIKLFDISINETVLPQLSILLGLFLIIGPFWLYSYSPLRQLPDYYSKNYSQEDTQLVQEIKHFDVDNSSYTWYGETFVFMTEIPKDNSDSKVVLSLITDDYFRVEVNENLVFASKGAIEYHRHGGRPIPNSFLPNELDITEWLFEPKNIVKIFVTNNTIRRTIGLSSELKLWRNGDYMNEPLFFECFTNKGKKIPYELMSWDEITDSWEFYIPHGRQSLSYSISGIRERTFIVPGKTERSLVFNSVSLSIILLIFLAFLQHYYPAQIWIFSKRPRIK